MSDIHLILPGAERPVPVHTRKHPTHWSYRIIMIVGLVAILAGAADIVARFSHTVLGECGTGAAFGPAISAIDPSFAPESQVAGGCK